MAKITKQELNDIIETQNNDDEHLEEGDAEKRKKILARVLNKCTDQEFRYIHSMINNEDFKFYLDR